MSVGAMRISPSRNVMCMAKNPVRGDATGKELSAKRVRMATVACHPALIVASGRTYSLWH